MKVLAINGSPHKEGTTYTALTIIAEVLKADGIETEIFHIGSAGIHGCIGCYQCRDMKKCVFDNDSVNACMR